ncbi:MAG: ATP-binding protein [Thermodesulfobacteriota bacterium]
MKDRFLFSVCPENEFFDRTGEIEYILARAGGDARPPGLFLSGGRWTGKTEILRRAHASLFWDQARVLPVYYQFRDYGAAEGLVDDYLKEVLKQFLAFGRREPALVGQDLTLGRLEEMLACEGLDMAGPISIHRDARKAGDIISGLRNVAGLPKCITEQAGIPVYLMLDDLDEGASMLAGYGPGAAGEFMEAFGRGGVPFVASGSTKDVLDSGVLGSVEPLRLRGLEPSEAGSMMMELCRQYDVGFDSEVLSFAAGKLEGNPMYMKNIVWAARRASTGFLTLKDFIDLYAKELFDGNIGLALRSSIRLRGLAELKALHAITSGGTSEEALSERFGLPAGQLRQTLKDLCAEGLVDAALGSVRWAGDGVARDFVRFNYETRVRGRDADEVRTFMVRDGLKEGFDLKGAVVRGRLKEETASLLSLFNGQKVLKVLLDNRSFCARYPSGAEGGHGGHGDQGGQGGQGDAGHEGQGVQAGQGVQGSAADELTLPQIIGCFDSTVWEKNETGPPVIIANGFENNRYDAGNEVVWVAAVKDSLTPVNIGDVENFLRRGQILRQNFRTTRVFKWFVGREGFTLEARKRLDAEGVFSSDQEQVRVLRDSLEDREAAGPPGTGNVAPNKEFEVVLPASTKAELVAARAVEEIGTEMGFDEIAIGQIKAALIEACINAFEHSKAKATKVFLRFVSGGGRLVIHVQNGGVDFDRAPGRAVTAAESGELRKRGWGLELMKGLMDEVRFEKIRGGTKVVMVKYLIKGDNRDEQA